MKKIVSVLLLLAVILTSCALADDPQEDPNIVVVEIKEVSATGITVTVKNNFWDSYVFGEDYYLERKNEKNWEEVPELEDEFFFNMIAYSVQPKGETEWSTNWEHRYFLEKGEYRIVKDGWFENEEGQQTATHRMTAEFVIE